MRLGYIHDQEIRLVTTEEPWRLPVRALVVRAKSFLHCDLARVAHAWQLEDSVRNLAMSAAPSEPGILHLERDGRLHTTLIAVSDPEEDDPKADRLILGSALAEARKGMWHSSVAISAILLSGSAIRLLSAIQANPARDWGSSLIVLYLSDDDARDEFLRAWSVVEQLPGVRDVSPDTTLTGGVTSDLVPADALIEPSDDRLGVSAYAAMLATALAGDTTPMPQSVGVFGEWGSGKSYFMGLLRGQVDLLSGSHGHCERVVQIGFNAWHYADTDLWASLGDVIFSDLAKAVRPFRAEDRADLKKTLMEKLDQHGDLEDTVAVAAVTAEELRARIDAASAQHTASTRDLFTAVTRSSELRERVADVWEKTGVTDEVEQLRLFAGELNATADTTREVIGMANERKGRLALTAAGVALVVMVVLATAAPDIYAAVSGAVAVISGLCGAWWLVRVREGVHDLHTLAVDLRAGIDRASQERLAASLKHELDELTAAEERRAAALAQLARVESEVGELETRLAGSHPERRATEFLDDRATGDRYTSGLGSVSVVRKDFQELVELLTSWRADPGECGAPVDRVILYIDDLDRCGPRQVVRVLEAIHLILALDLFAVVVGVDPRWLLRSLSAHYAEILDDQVLDQWRVAPEDYLEKIINIPFSLPRMRSNSVSHLVRSILPAAPPKPEVPRKGADPGFPYQPQEGPPTAEIAVETGAELEIGVATAPNGITERELRLLDHIGDVVTTPRSAKRLLNLYRMIRATRNLASASTFLGSEPHPGDFQAVIVLLSVLCAAPAQAGAVLDNLTRATARGRTSPATSATPTATSIGSDCAATSPASRQRWRPPTSSRSNDGRSGSDGSPTSSTERPAGTATPVQRPKHRRQVLSAQRRPHRSFHLWRFGVSSPSHDLGPSWQSSRSRLARLGIVQNLTRFGYNFRHLRPIRPRATPVSNKLTAPPGR